MQGFFCVPRNMVLGFSSIKNCLATRTFKCLFDNISIILLINSQIVKNKMHFHEHWRRRNNFTLKKNKKNSVFSWALLNTLLLFWRNVKKELFHIHALRIFTNSEFISQKIRWYCPARWFFNKKRHCKFVSSLALFFSCFTAKEEAIITNCPLSMQFFSRPLIGPQITWPGGGGG